ncbi:LAFA_0E01706g1_1 [Lachancea sp. 'fantastica']|nr:LAFA_0E01706g1_1 [Lachancea sp. 'fantastica']
MVYIARLKLSLMLLDTGRYSNIYVTCDSANTQSSSKQFVITAHLYKCSTRKRCVKLHKRLILVPIIFVKDQVSTKVASMTSRAEQEYSDVLRNLDVGFLKDNDEWVNIVKKVNWEQIASVDSLIKSTEQLVLKYTSPNQTIKDSIQKVFENALARYPLLFGYWKRFTAVQYQLQGLESSLDVLSRAVDAFPNSLELWCDYLNVLIANNPHEVDKIRMNFQIAKDLVGYQFLSHPFWDRYIEFESNRERLDNLVAIYKTVSHIPLHQYSKYYTAYKTFANDNAEKTELQIDSEEEISAIFANTQNLVNSVWKFESQISQSYFNLGPLPQSELDNWENYLSFAVESKLVKPNLTKSIFERCLIPCQYYEHFWLRYTSWIEKTESFDTTLEAFQRGIGVVPASSRKLRQNFLTFLKSSLKVNQEKSLDIYFLTLAEFAREYPNDGTFINDFLTVLKRSEFGSSLSIADQDIIKQQRAFAGYLEKNVRACIRNSEDGDHRLQNIVNETTLSVLVISLIKVTYYNLGNTAQTRALLSEFEKLPQLKSSAPFWLQYYKILKSTEDLNSLENFVNRLGNEIHIPVLLINDIVSDFKSFFMTNVNLGDYEQEVYDGRYNISIDPLVDLDFKVNDPLWIKRDTFKSTEKVRKDKKDNGHPGLYLEKPVVSNSVIESQSKTFANLPPPLPTFKNLEKVNKAAVHKDFFSSDFLHSN